MYATLNAKWKEIKNAEEFTETFKVGEYVHTYILRAIVDWKQRKIYKTWNEAEPKEYKEEDMIELIISDIYGPYGTEASVKTALSKIKREMRGGNSRRIN